MGARKFQVPIDLSKLELQNAVMHTLAGAPSSPVKFQVYGNSTDNILYWWDGTQWIAAKDSGAGAGITTVRDDGITMTQRAAINFISTTGIIWTATDDAAQAETELRADPAFGAVTAQTSFGASSTNGSAGTLSRSDHAHGTPTHLAADHSTIPISALAAATGSVSMGGNTITNVGTPSNGTDAANKNYVDNAINGLNWKDSCRVATTANHGLTGLTAIDGVTPIAGDRVLVKNQTTQSQNGIYVAAAGAWSRAVDVDSAAEILQSTVFIEEGTQADTAWTCTTNAPITLGSTNITYAQFGAGATYTAGNGLTLTGNTFDVVAGDTTLTVAADSVVVNTSVIATRAYVDGVAAKRYAVDIGGATAITVTHNLNTKDVIVQVWDLTTPFAQLECDVEHATVNTVILRFASAPAAASLRCVVLA